MELDERYVELLAGIGIEVESTKKPESLINDTSCCGQVETYDGMFVCTRCGKVTDEYVYDSREPLHRYGHGEVYGSKSSENVKFYRPYHALTHFREHLRRYLGDRFQQIPDNLIDDVKATGLVDPKSRQAFNQVKLALKQLKGQSYEVRYWDREMRRYYTKKYRPQKFYKEIFTIIHRLGGIRPKVEKPMIILRTFKVFCYYFNEMRRKGETSRHNMPSHYMMLNLLLREFGHEPYYDIPALKDTVLRNNVRKIFDLLKDNVQETMGVFQQPL